MFFKKSLAVSGYISSLFGGGYLTYDYLQDKTIGDLLGRLGTQYSRKEEFEKSYKLLKDDPQFRSDINDGKSFSEDKGWELLKNWCFSKYRILLTEDNIKKIFPSVRKYCSDSKKIETKSAGSFNWQKARNDIAKKGISKNGQLFVRATVGSGLGNEKTTAFCWDTNTNNWIASEDNKICWKNVNI